MTEDGERLFDPDPEEDQRRGLPKLLRDPLPSVLERQANLVIVRQQLMAAQGAHFRPRCEWQLDGDECEGRIHLHHFWPRGVFPAEVAEAMHKAYLCSRHHTMWHDALQLFYVRQYVAIEDRVNGRP